MAKQLSDNEKGTILELVGQKQSLRKISKKIKKDPKTVRNFMKKLRKTKSFKRKTGSGRPSKLTKKEKNHIKLHSLRNRFDTCKKIKDTLRLDVTPTTIGNVLKSFGIKSRTPRRKPILTKEHKKKRRAWAKKYQDWVITDWEKVLFSDESLIHLVPQMRRRYVHRRRGEALKQECISGTVKHGGGNVKLWGYFGNYKPGCVVFIEGTLTGNQYIDILKKNMIPIAHKLIGREFIYQEDNDPKHGGDRGCRAVKEFFKEEKINRLDWPPQSPDLNPIEHLWGDLKKRLASSKCASIPELKKRITEEFEKTDGNYIRKLLESMPQRCKAVIRADGGHTKY